MGFARLNPSYHWARPVERAVWTIPPLRDTRGGKISAPRRSILKRAPAPDVWVAPVLLAEVGKPSA